MGTRALIQMNIDPDFKQRIRRAAKLEHTSMSDYIRRVVLREVRKTECLNQCTHVDAN